MLQLDNLTAIKSETAPSFNINWMLTLKLVPTSLNVKQPHNELSILECPKNLNIWLVLSQLINNLVFCVPNHH